MWKARIIIYGQSVNSLVYSEKCEDLPADVECSSRAASAVVIVAAPPLPSASAPVLVDSG